MIIFLNILGKLIHRPTKRFFHPSLSCPYSTVHPDMGNRIFLYFICTVYISLLMQQGRHFVLQPAACCQHFFTASGCECSFFCLFFFVLLKTTVLWSPRMQEKDSTLWAAPNSQLQTSIRDDVVLLMRNYLVIKYNDLWTGLNTIECSKFESFSEPLYTCMT